MTYDPSRSIRKPIDLSGRIGENAVFNFFNAVYAWMCVGLAVTAVTGWAVSQNRAMVLAFNQGGLALIFLVGLVLFAGFVQSIALRISAFAGTVLFLLFAALMGAFLSSIFIVYSLGTIGSAFFLTAGTFGAMSIYGFITKKDLTSVGSFLIMAMWGAFLALIVNFFLASGPLSWILTYAILAIFIGMTAYDTQKLKSFAYQYQGDAVISSRMVVVGSLILYLDFINMFLSILRILGGKRR